MSTGTIGKDWSIEVASAIYTAPTEGVQNTTNLRVTSTVTTTPPANSTVTITQLAPLPSSGSGESYAVACQSEYQTWKTHYLEFYQNASSYITTITATQSIYVAEPTVKPYTLCDGIPRYNQTRAHVTTTISTSRVQTEYPTYPVPRPRCSIQDTDCAGVQKHFNSILKTSNGTYTYWEWCKPIHTANVFSRCGPCRFVPKSVQLLYWPVTTTNGNLCSGDGSTITATPTGSGPNTAVVNGTTFTSPTVYLAYDTLAAKDFCGWVGNPRTSGVITLNPTDLSSMPASGIPGGGLQPTQVNFAHLPPNLV